MVWAVCVTVPAEAHSQTLHVVGVFDIAATGIGDSVRFDQKQFERVFQKPAIRQSVRITSLNNGLTPDSVLSTALSIDLKNGDAFLFYFSGHGRAAADFYNGPEMLVGDSAISRVQLWERLERQYGNTARMIAVVTDCCYSASDVGGPCGAADIHSDALLRSLFLECPVGTRVDLNSCMPRQVALSRGKMPSCFTESFTSTFDLNADKTWGWARFLTDVRSSTASLAEMHIRLANEHGVSLGAKQLQKGADCQQRSQTIYLVPSRSNLINDTFSSARFGVTPKMAGSSVVIDTTIDGTIGGRVLQRNDKIVSINGETVTSPEQMTRLVYNSSKNMEIYWMRGGKRMGVTAILPW